MLELREAIVVEGKYDKIALEALVHTAIFTTDGFGIFNNKEKMALLRSVAEKRGLIVLTDSDGAGLLIRNRLRSSIDARYLKHAYIPEVLGKERRKTRPSRAGTLGVEGMSVSTLEEVLRRAGATLTPQTSVGLTKADLYAMGLSGGKDSSVMRKELCTALSLPTNLSAAGLLDAVNSLYTREEFSAAVEALEKKRGEISHQQNGGGV